MSNQDFHVTEFDWTNQSRDQALQLRRNGGSFQTFSYIFQR